METLFLPSGFSDKTICISISMVMAVGMYAVLYRRLIRRKHSRDLSKAFCWLNLGIQMNNGVLAFSEHAPFLVTWYIVQTVFTAALLCLVYHYWEYPDPSRKLSIK